MPALGYGARQALRARRMRRDGTHVPIRQMQPHNHFYMRSHRRTKKAQAPGHEKLGPLSARRCVLLPNAPVVPHAGLGDGGRPDQA